MVHLLYTLQLIGPIYDLEFKVFKIRWKHEKTYELRDDIRHPVQ